MPTKGGASRGLSVFLRLGELACGAVVLGIIGRLLDLVDEAGSSPNARLIYTVVVASLTIIFSLFFILPLAYSFWAFPIDLFMFAAWLAAFCLLETLTGTDTCDSWWYDSYWGYYWGRWYRVGPVGINVNWSGCSAWRTALAFTFVAMFTYLMSFCLGLYWISAYGRVKDKGRRLWRNGVVDPLRSSPPDVVAAPQAAGTKTGPTNTTAPV
ncbi:hypothetical protein QBC37DRAFT_450193 [Rhypophila decipiens]|uniref:MARVEL domain-containing protein n=1 Tax=Rhypophila decipiens TaxID=261697 RepID=A0AAN6XZC8_9PEZI|nr:hypothetical protein QBC37DRAFT_450193 [Rhypophila decipiens]